MLVTSALIAVAALLSTSTADSAGYFLPSSGVASTTQFYLGPELSGGTACGVSALPNGKSTSGKQGGGPGYLYIRPTLPPHLRPKIPDNSPLGSHQPAGIRRKPLSIRGRRTGRSLRSLLLDHPSVVLGRGAVRQRPDLQGHRRVPSLGFVEWWQALQSMHYLRSQRYGAALAFRYRC